MKQINIAEIKEELSSMFAGRRNLIDTILPPLLFVIINEFVGFDAAMWSSLIVAAVLAVYRTIRGQSVFSAFGGVAGVLIAVLAAKWIGRDESYFLPGILSNVFWVVVFGISMLVGRPVLALGSYFLRRWPIEWYWHPRVRPAYMEISLIWLVMLSGRTMLQVYLYNNQAVGELAMLTLFTGAPMTVALLVLSYIYGKWRLKQLKGPSVQEYQSGTLPPWEGQRRGF